MKPLPSIARQRLEATTANSHPDPGVLTAFVEHSLGRAQREQILHHLGACSRCNQVVALAAPQNEEVQVVITGRNFSSAGFRPWRWITGSALAGALAVAAIFMVIPPRVAPPIVSSPPAQIAATQPAPSASVPQPATRSIHQSGKNSRVTVTSHESTEAMIAKARTEERLGPHAADVTITTPPPPTESAVEPTVPEKSATQAPPGMSSVAAPAAGPCWRVSDAGALEKSLDCAGSWTTIALPEQAVVRVVQSAGNMLWVGGNGGALFFSSDAGQHWNRVRVPALSADVVAIVFGTPTHGWLSTSNGETWTTTDGGVIWKRR